VNPKARRTQRGPLTEGWAARHVASTHQITKLSEPFRANNWRQMATPSAMDDGATILPAGGMEGGRGRCSELLEVHISKDMEHPLTGVNRGFGQLSDLPPLAFIDIKREETL
jgi:hypothetical protein